MDRIQVPPVRDASVYKPFKKKLPFRKLYHVQVLDHATGSIPQTLDALKTAGPFQVWGLVPIQETVFLRDDHKRISSVTTEEGEFVHVKAENIIEWTHEFNINDVRHPVFWVLSENVCWYQIQTIHNSYKPYFEPLTTVYAIIHSVEALGVVDDLALLIPSIASILGLSIEEVTQELDRHRDHLIDLCSADLNLKRSRFYRQWVDEKANQLKNDDSNVWDNQNATSNPENLEYEDQEFEIVPAALQETYDRLPAPCTEDVCPLHFPEVMPTFNALSIELEALVTNRFDQDKSGWSEPNTFHCPIPGCLATVCNAVCSSSTEHIGEILHHLGQHDLSTGNGEMIVVDYLMQTKRPKANASKRDIKDPQQNLNLQLYWVLKSGGLQYKHTPIIKRNEPMSKTRAMSKKRSRGGCGDISGIIPSGHAKPSTAEKRRLQGIDNFRAHFPDKSVKKVRKHPSKDDSQQLIKTSPSPVDKPPPPLPPGDGDNNTSGSSMDDVSHERPLINNGGVSSVEPIPAVNSQKRQRKLASETRESSDSSEDVLVQKPSRRKRFCEVQLLLTDSDQEISDHGDRSDYVVQDSGIHVLKSHSKDAEERQYHERQEDQGPDDKGKARFRGLMAEDRKRRREEYSDSSGAQRVKVTGVALMRTIVEMNLALKAGAEAEVGVGVVTEAEAETETEIDTETESET
ncbi:hypothetical protein BGZ79_000056 [Entomortierella chlamydospora]|nr:hypothetical protein BGZ79_000056 [Entomortierella chlamydospora]